MRVYHGEAYRAVGMTLEELCGQAPSAMPVFYRTYSRKGETARESWSEVTERAVAGLRKIGAFTEEQAALVADQMEKCHAMPSGRWLWIGGTPWGEKPENYSSAYNCTSTRVLDIDAFGHMMDLAMMGSGTGAMLEHRYVDQLPLIRCRMNVRIVRHIGVVAPEERRDVTRCLFSELPSQNGGVKDEAYIVVGDSRAGWVSAYSWLLRIATSDRHGDDIDVKVDLGNVRPAGEPLAGFGGTANPVKLGGLFERVGRILSSAYGRKLTPLECCLIIDEAASTVVAGNIRRSAGMRQFDADDMEAQSAKANLWSVTEDGEWKIDPEKDALRMANHTLVFHRRPSLEEIHDSLVKQFSSGEGAIQFAPEAIARANCDLLGEPGDREKFIDTYCDQGPSSAKAWLKGKHPDIPDAQLDERMERYGLNPCGEIIGSDFHCNLAEVHLNMIDPECEDEQEEAFRAAALSVAALLHHRFVVDRYRDSRMSDPIVGVSFTGYFDYCVWAMGVNWLKWFGAGRPDTEEGREFKAREAADLSRWRKIVETTVADYCEVHGLRRPNRCTTVQPGGTKSLLTGASSGWHPPKAAYFIRRITFGRMDPVAQACMDYGYTVVPGQGDKDDEGVLLSDPFDPRCTEWLVEIPTSVLWARLCDAAGVEPGKFSAAAQFDFYMNIQRHYTTHNTSATIEFTQEEIPELSRLIHEAIEGNAGYISAALLARFEVNTAYPRLPFEPISRETFVRRVAEEQDRWQGESFAELLQKYDSGSLKEAGPMGCDGDKCLIGQPVTKPPLGLALEGEEATVVGKSNSSR